MQSGITVYRTIFSVNRSQILYQSEDFIPQVARNPFYRDVTSSYVRTTDITININHGKDRPERLYLGIQSWMGG